MQTYELNINKRYYLTLFNLFAKQKKPPNYSGGFLNFDKIIT